MLKSVQNAARFNCIILMLSITGLLLSAVSISARAENPPAGKVLMKLHTLNDPGSGNMPSHTILAPADWKVEGGAWWPAPQFFNILPTQDIKVTAPDGRLVHIGPSLGASDFRPSAFAQAQLGARRADEGSADNGNLVLYMPNTLDEWKTFLLEKAFKKSLPTATNFTMKSVVVIPELTAMLKKQLEPIIRQQEISNQQSRQMGLAMHSFADGAVLSGTCFYELDGKKWEHLIVFGTTQVGTDSQTGRQLWWAIEPSVSYRAEAGQLEANMPLFMAIANSVRMTPKWQAMKSDHSAKMNQIAAKGAADRSRIIANSNREISKIINDGYNERQASMDRTQKQVINAIRGVDDYTVPGSQDVVQLPNNYSHIYSNGNGEYLMTNDSLYNPNTDSNINNHTWSTMEAAK